MHTEKINAGKKEVELRIIGFVQNADAPPGFDPARIEGLEDLANFGIFFLEEWIFGLVISAVEAAGKQCLDAA